MSPRNKKIQILTNLFHSHSTNVIKHNDKDYIAIDNIYNEANNIVNLIEQPKPSVYLTLPLNQGISLNHLMVHYTLV